MARRKKRVDPLRALTERELRRQANQLLASALVQPKQQIRRQQAEARRQAEADAQTIQGFTRALAELVGQAGPNVERVYGQATDRQRQIAEGFANQQRAGDEAAAAQANALIQAQGGTRHIDPGTGSAVTYAMGGAVPSNLLNETGAAMASIAHGYGAGVAGRGQQQLMQRQSQAMKEQAKLREAWDELMAKVPGLRSEIMDKLYQREISKAATRIQGDYLGLAQGREAFDQSYDLANLDLKQQELANEAAGKKNENRVKARNARMEALSDAREPIWVLAGELGARTKQVPGAGQQPNRPPPQQAYSVLWSRYGQGLMRYAPAGHRAWWRRQIDAMIWNALTSNGFKKPRNAQQRNRAVAPNNRKITRPGPS